LFPNWHQDTKKCCWA